MIENPERLLQKDVQQAKQWLRSSERPSSGWPLYDSAVLYFEKSYMEILGIHVSYRNKHRDLLSPYTRQEAEENAEMYEHMFPRVVSARDILERNQPILMKSWRNSESGSEEMAHIDVIASVLSHEPSYRLGFVDQAESDEEWMNECQSVVQWMRRWIQSEST